MLPGSVSISKASSYHSYLYGERKFNHGTSIPETQSSSKSWLNSMTLFNLNIMYFEEKRITQI